MKISQKAIDKGIAAEIAVDGPENDLQIRAYMHCGLCLDEWKNSLHVGNISPADYAQLSVGSTGRGIQVWCRRHNCNVLHIDFEGVQHPANMTRKRP